MLPKMPKTCRHVLPARATPKRTARRCQLWTKSVSWRHGWLLGCLAAGGPRTPGKVPEQRWGLETGMRRTLERDSMKAENRVFSNPRFIGKWQQWYRVLRYRKGFGYFDSFRYGLWLARG